MHGLAHGRTRGGQEGDNAIAALTAGKPRGDEARVGGETLRQAVQIVIIGRAELGRDQILNGGAIFQAANAIFQRCHLISLPC
jgi:hypothetical protein